MIDNSNISVLIVGNPDASAGESVLLHINSSSSNFDELGKIFYDSIISDYYIEIINGVEGVTYAYVVSPATVHSAGSNRPGIFWIGVTIPRGKKIINTYDLIIELKNKFQQLYMTQFSDGSYEFRNIDYSIVEFKAILEKYKLVDSTSEYIQMIGAKKITINLISDNKLDSDAERIKKLLDNTHYDEFKNYSSIIVSEKYSVMPSLSVKVPRKPYYYIVKIAQDYGYLESSYNENMIDYEYNKKFKGKFYKNDYYERSVITFKISDIEKNITFDNFEYEIDNENRFIIVKPKYKPKIYKIYIQAVGINDLPERISMHIDDNLVEIKNDDEGWYIELEGESVKTVLSLGKNDNYDDICDYSIENPVIDKDINKIIINLIENSTFNGVRISNIPEDIDRKIILRIGEINYSFQINDEYSNSNYQIMNEDIEKNTSRYVSSSDISDCNFESSRYRLRTSSRNYYKRLGWLVFELKN